MVNLFIGCPILFEHILNLDTYASDVVVVSDCIDQLLIPSYYTCTFVVTWVTHVYLQFTLHCIEGGKLL